MSKSLGNFFTVRDLLDRGVPGEVMRLVLLSTHYRQPIDWTEAKVHEATVLLTLWEKLLRDASRVDLAAAEGAEPSPEVLAALGRRPQHAAGAQAPARPRERRPARRQRRRRGARAVRGGPEPDGHQPRRLPVERHRAGARPRVRRRRTSASFGARIAAILKAREGARAARDFARADALRDGLLAAGIKVMDRAGAASEWEIGPDFDPAKLDGIEA